MRCEYNLKKQVNPKIIAIRDYEEYGFKRNMEVFIKESSYVDRNGDWFCDFGAMNEYFELYIDEKVYSPLDFEVVYFCHDYMIGIVLMTSNVKNNGYIGLVLKEEEWAF